MSDDEKILLFPFNRVKDKNNIGPKQTDYARRIKKEQTKKFTEQVVDELALKLIKEFSGLAMKTHTIEFTKDFAFLVDVLRSLVKRDFGMNHIVQKMVDKSVVIKENNQGNQVATINYDAFGYKPKSKPLSEDVSDELNGGGIEFIPDFDPHEDK